MKYILRNIQNITLPILVILLTVLGWYIVIRQGQILTQTSITLYQQTELEIVRTMARSVESYVHEQIRIRERDDITELEQEIFEKFIAPVHLLENGDAWIYAPDHVVFDLSSDFPEEYWGKNMAEIFALQQEAGANHYEEMTEAVINAREGVGWYVWLPEKGREIAAWTPVSIGEYTWSIGLSTPLPEILESTGTANQMRTSITLMSLATTLSLGLLLAWIGSTTKRSLAEQALRESEQRFRQVISSISDHIYMTNLTKEGRYYISENIENLTGYPPDKFGVYWDFWQSLIHPEDQTIFANHIAQLAQEQDSEVEYRLIQANGNIIWVRDSGRVEKDRLQQTITVYGVVSNITERKQAEEDIKASLREKEVLLQEIHHRVKNNLQVISSLLSLQSGYINDDQVLEIFQDSQHRIRSMALIHEKLYRSENLARIDFAEYTQEFTAYLLNAHRIYPQEIRLDVRVDEIFLRIDHAVPCGLIVNELVSNALKYAFPDGQAGIIHLDLQKKDDQEVILQIGDNGIGFPTNVDFRNTDSLGLQLVNTLVRQLDGNIELDNSCGTEFTVTFPVQ